MDYPSINNINLEKMLKNDSSGPQMLFFEFLPTFRIALEEAKKSFNSNNNFFSEFHNLMLIHGSSLTDAMRTDALSFIKDEWEYLESFQKGFITIHTRNVVVMTYLDPDFEDLSPDSKNILMWSCFLHDISKRGSPLIIGKDHVHPFNCAATTIKIFQRLKFITDGEERVSELLAKIKSSFEILKPSLWDTILNCCAEIQNHSKVDTFMPLVKMVCNTKFLYSVFVIICFHQSIHVLKKYPHRSVLSEEQILSIFDVDLMRLYKFMMSHDSLSYTYLSLEVSASNKAEIHANIDFWLLKLNKKNQL